jgi:preprotein translocase subunit SecE
VKEGRNQLSEKVGKIRISETDAEPEAEASGADSFDGAPPKAPRANRSAGGGGRERGLSSSREGLFGRLSQFVRDVRAELKRVSWPTPKEVKNTTIITLVAVIFFAAYLFLVDQALARLILGLTWLVNKLLGAV